MGTLCCSLCILAERAGIKWLGRGKEQGVLKDSLTGMDTVISVSSGLRNVCVLIFGCTWSFSLFWGRLPDQVNSVLAEQSWQSSFLIKNHQYIAFLFVFPILRMDLEAASSLGPGLLPPEVLQLLLLRSGQTWHHLWSKSTGHCLPSGLPPSTRSSTRSCHSCSRHVEQFS